MRATLLALSLFAFTCVQVFGQQQYERAYPSPNYADDWSVTYSTLDNTLWYAVIENADIVLHHLNSSGTIMSTYKYGGLNPQDVTIEQSVNGNIYISGMRSVSGINYYMLALDFTGSVVWTKNYSIGSMMNYGQSSLRTLNNGNVMIVESVYGHIGYIEVDGNTGSVVNSAQLREDTTVENKTPGFAGDVHNDGSFVLTGKRGSDIAMVRTTPQGTILWSTVLNSGFAYYHTKGVTACSDGSTIACGMEDFTGFIMKVDANGAVQWYNSYTGGMVFYDAEQIDANTIGVCGTMGNDFIYTRIDMNGNEIGTITFAHQGYSFMAYELCVNQNGRVAIPFGYYDASLMLPQTGLVLLDPNFNLECGMNYTPLTPSTTSADPSIVNIPIYSINEPVTVTNLLSSPSVTSTGVTEDMCVILGVAQPQTTTTVQLQNSPAERGQSVTFSLGDYQGEVAYSVTDALGREVARNVITYGGGMVPIEKSQELAPGVYLFTTYMNGVAYTEKFMIR